MANHAYPQRCHQLHGWEIPKINGIKIGNINYVSKWRSLLQCEIRSCCDDQTEVMMNGRWWGPRRFHHPSDKHQLVLHQDSSLGLNRSLEDQWMRKPIWVKTPLLESLTPWRHLEDPFGMVKTTKQTCGFTGAFSLVHQFHLLKFQTLVG